MPFSPKNKQKLKNSVKTNHRIYPRLKWNMKFLSLATIDLAKEIIKESEENPFLDMDHSYEYNIHSPFSDKLDSNEKMWENLGDQKMSIFAELNEQINQRNLDNTSREILELIFSSLNERGFSSISTADILDYGYTKKEIKKARITLKELEPTGIGAENIFENLLWQAEYRFNKNVFLTDILDFLSENFESVFPSSKTSDEYETVYSPEKIKTFLQEHLQLNSKIIDEAILKIQELNPYPLESREVMEKYIIPDIIFNDTPNGIKIEIPSSGIPDIHINENLMQEFLKAASKEEKKHWKEKYETAVFIQESLRYRKASLMKLGNYILKKQISFFAKNANIIQPLNLQDAAEDLNLHISTVSRLVSQKYCQTKWGTFLLKMFFPHGIKTENGLIPIETLKKQIIDITQNENPEKPLSDQKISEKLKEKGIHVERRTVAKYRNLLHIPSAFKRKAINNINKGEQ